MARATLPAFTLYTLADLSRTITDQLPASEKLEIEVTPGGATYTLNFPQIERGDEEESADFEIRERRYALRVIDDLSKFFGARPDLNNYHVRWIFFGATVQFKIGSGYYPVRSAFVKGENE